MKGSYYVQCQDCLAMTMNLPAHRCPPLLKMLVQRHREGKSVQPPTSSVQADWEPLRDKMRDEDHSPTLSNHSPAR